MAALIAVNEVFTGRAARNGLFKNVGVGGFVGCFGVWWFYAEQGAELADEGLGIGAFGCAGGGPAGEEVGDGGFDFQGGLGLFRLRSWEKLFFLERVGLGGGDRLAKYWA